MMASWVVFCEFIQSFIGRLQMKKRNIKIREINIGQGNRILTSKIDRKSKRMFATGDNKNKVTVWLIDDDEAARELSSGSAANSEISALCYTNSGNQVISGSSRGIINLWDIDSSKISTTLRGHSASVTAFSTFAYEDFRLASGSYDTNIKLWDLRSKNNTATLKHHSEQITSIDVSPDSKLLLSGSMDSTTKIWDLRYPEKIIFTYTEHTGPINMVKFNPEDIMFATGSSDKTAKYFRCEPGYYTFISSTEMGTNPITAIEFSEDGRILYTAANDSLKLWNMGKHGLLLDSIESPWKGVQDLCMIEDTLTGIAWSPAGLSVWAYTSPRPYSKEKKRERAEEEEKLVLPSINPPQPPPNINRLEELKQVSSQINQIQDRIRSIQQIRLEKQDSKKEEKDPFEQQISSNRSQKSQGQQKKKNFIQEIEKRREQQSKKKIEDEKRKIEDERKRAEQDKRIADEEKRKKIQAQRKKEEERKKAIEEAKKRAQEEKERREREKRQQEEIEARRAEQQRELRDLEIQRFNQNMAKQQQNKFSQANHLLESILEEQKMDSSLNVSAFMGDQLHKQKFKQYDLISDILKDDSKFTAVLSVRKNLLKPILKWWSQNNIKNALYAINEAQISVVVDALQAIVSTPKYKGNITPDVAIHLIRKSAQLMLNKHYRYVRNGIFYINQIALMYKQQLIKLKTFNPGGRVDISRQERMAKYDRLIEEFLNVFRMERLKKYSKQDQTQELNQLALELYKNLEEILRKCLPKNQGEMVPG